MVIIYLQRKGISSENEIKERLKQDYDEVKGIQNLKELHENISRLIKIEDWYIEDRTIIMNIITC